MGGNMNDVGKMEEMNDQTKKERAESASSPLSQEALPSTNANATTLPPFPSESSPSPPAPTSTPAVPSQFVNSSPPVASPPSNSTASKSDPGSSQSASPFKPSSAPPPTNNASPPPPPPASWLPLNSTPPSPVPTPTEPLSGFSPPHPQSPPKSADSKTPPLPTAPILLPPPTQGPPYSSPSSHVLAPTAPTNPPAPAPPNSSLTINSSPTNPLTPGSSTSEGTHAEPDPLTPSGVEAPTNISQGTSSSENVGSYVTAPSSSHVSPSSGVIVASTFCGAIIVVIAVFLVFLAKRKRRLKGLDKQYQPTPDASTKITDGQHKRKVSNIGDHFQLVGYDVSGSPVSPYAGELSYVSHGDYGYHAEVADATGARSWFTYEELLGITNAFSQENKIGEGGFGSVYHGILPDGRTAAIKQLKIGSGQGEREFRAEVEIISRIHHRHLVSLLGYCISEHHRLLVYEFVPNKTLEYHLHAKEQIPLDWQKRVKIALGSARGLVYLHEYCHPQIIHRDIKSANILLDSSFEAMVADFGLAKLTNETSTHVSTRVVGTFGYMAPEYAASGKLTDKSDVYSFGVVLLELISGRKPVDISRPLGDESLVEWARPHLAHALETGRCEELVDPMLNNNFPKAGMLRMIEIAASCVRHSAVKRPRMAQVLRALESEEEVMDISNGVKVGDSVAYNSGQYSSDIRRFQRLAFETQELSSGFDPSIN